MFKRHRETSAAPSPEHARPSLTAKAGARASATGAALRARLPRARRVARGLLLAALLSRRTPQLPLLAVPVVAALWAAAVGLLGALALVAVAGIDSPGADSAVVLWFAAHHAPITTDIGTVTLLPLGLLLVPVLPLRRAGRFLATQVAPSHQALTAGVAVFYYVAVAVAAALLRSELPSTPPFWIGWWATLLAGAAGGWGVLRQRRGRLTWTPLAGAVARTAGVPLAVGLVLVVAVLISRFADIAAAQQQLVGDDSPLGVILIQLGYLPNLVVWAGAFAIGTGVNAGGGGVLSPYSPAQPLLPDLPIAVAIPTQPASVTALLPLLIVVAAAGSAVWYARAVPVIRLRVRVTRVLVVAAVTAVVWWVLGLLAGGAVGGARLADLGPVPATPLMMAVLSVAGGLLWALVPTLAAEARPLAQDVRERIATGDEPAQ